MNLFENINNELKTNYKSNQEIEWYNISKYFQLSEDFIDRYAKYVDWHYISCTQNLSEEFMNKHSKKIVWKMASKYQKMSEGFIEKHICDVDWTNISSSQVLSEKFMAEYRDMLDWYYLCCYQKMSENFIEEWRDYVDWPNIAVYQHLSEEFIKKYCFKLGFRNISKFQRLSESFIKRNKASLNLDCLAKYQNLTNRIRNDIFNNGNRMFIEKLINNNWIYKTTEEKKQVVIDTGLYECHDDYFIAYKAIRSDRYSMYNFQYKYDKGGVYESWCDCSEDENSFGLSVGTMDFANDYGESHCERHMIVRCKVKYSDIGRVVHDGKKVRCFKIEILD